MTDVTPSRAERLLEERRQRQEAAAESAVVAEVVDVTVRRASSFAEHVQQARPTTFVQSGSIVFDAGKRSHGALYDVRHLVHDPFRSRVADQNLEALATSLDEHGQQGPLRGRLITEHDRERSPGHFQEAHVLMVIDGFGGRILAAQPLTSTKPKLWVEPILPNEGESDLAYIRRCLELTTIHMVQSQHYTVADKANLVRKWIMQLAIESPSASDVASYFGIQRAEANRLLTVARSLDSSVEQAIVKAEHPVADEIVFHIARLPKDEQPKAYDRWAKMTVKQVRSQFQESKKTGAVTPKRFERAYAYRLKDESSEIVTIGTTLTAEEWRKKGGAKAFLKAVRTLIDRPEIQEQFKNELG